MSVEDNKALIRRFVDRVFNQNDLSALEEFLADDYVLHDSWDTNSGRVVRGAEGFREMTKACHAAFSGQKITIEDMFAEGDKVVTRWTSQGTHTGEFMGYKPTNKQFTMSGICIDRIENGKLAESWVIGNEAGMLRQLGILPEEYQKAA
jgi:steroid delta-isomerase-like uncharacterized protein